MTIQHKDVYIPNGIQFGSTVAIIPPVVWDLYYLGKMSSAHPDHSNPYCWINRGDPLGYYSIDVLNTTTPILKWFTGEHRKTAIIPSPVSGLLIRSNYGVDYNMVTDGVDSKNSNVILLPDDETNCENSSYMFNDLSDLCHNWYHASKTGLTYGPHKGNWSQERLKELMKKQFSWSCKYTDALPHYEGSFNEIKIIHPNLRQYLKHL